MLPPKFFLVIWFAPAARLRCTNQTGIPISELRRRAARPPLPWRLFVVILDYPLDKLRLRIQARVERMMGAGFLAEVETLRRAGFGRTRAWRHWATSSSASILTASSPWKRPWSRPSLATSAYARRQADLVSA